MNLARPFKAGNRADEVNVVASATIELAYWFNRRRRDDITDVTLGPGLERPG
ncbi:MAG TPA: hypothetical protein VKB86_17240 [Pyrinomonadaceae bacterium]|nr:hypothetical protein [Pyrinomonadaceae bacterium]